MIGRFVAAWWSRTMDRGRMLAIGVEVVALVIASLGVAILRPTLESSDFIPGAIGTALAIGLALLANPEGYAPPRRIRLVLERLAALVVGFGILVLLATLLAPVAERVAAAGVGGLQLLGLGLGVFYLAHVLWDRVYRDRRAAVVETVGVVLICAGIAGAVPKVPNGNIGILAMVIGAALILVANQVRRKPEASVAPAG